MQRSLNTSGTLSFLRPLQIIIFILDSVSVRGLWLPTLRAAAPCAHLPIHHKHEISWYCIRAISQIYQTWSSAQWRVFGVSMWETVVGCSYRRTSERFDRLGNRRVRFCNSYMKTNCKNTHSVDSSDSCAVYNNNYEMQLWYDMGGTRLLCICIGTHTYAHVHMHVCMRIYSYRNKASDLLRQIVWRIAGVTVYPET